MRVRGSRRSGVVVGLVLALSAVSALTALSQPTAARADSAPPARTTPATVTADVLPTTQINGVAWTQLVLGNTVYVGGSFTTARPAGAAPGTGTTARANLLAFDIRTGTLISSWAPKTNGAVLTITATPDAKKLYLGGSFTRVNGRTRYRIARITTANGALDPAFHPSSDSTVTAITATRSTVYFGGLTTAVSGVARNRLAAVRASNGKLLSWAPKALGGRVRALAISPDGTKILVGGQFATLNGASVGGLGAVGTNGKSVRWLGNKVVRAAGASSSIQSLTSAGNSVYVTAFGTSRTFEGVARLRWSDGAVQWVADCHGDSYDTFAQGAVVYVASHAHYCGNVPGGFPQTRPATFHHATALTTSVKGKLTADIFGYKNYTGQRAPALLKWQPVMTTGTYTGQNQATWTVGGNSTYVVYGGEFGSVNGKPQQGLVRFGPKSVAPNKTGPVLTGARIVPTVRSTAAGTVEVSWNENWDRDNQWLTYSVIRDGATTKPVHRVSADWAYDRKTSSTELAPETFTFTDTGLKPGVHRYRIFVADPLGNEVRSDTVTITIS